METILVVADQEAVRTLVCGILRRQGYTAIPARSGVEAQWYAEQHGNTVDLLVTDLMLPETDGYHLGIPFGQLHPHTPVLFMSSWPHEETIRRGLLHPRAPYLQKPFPPRVLRRKVRQVLDDWCTPPAA